MSWEDIVRRVNRNFRSKREILQELEETRSLFELKEFQLRPRLTYRVQDVDKKLRIFEDQFEIPAYMMEAMIRDDTLEDYIRTNISSDLAKALQPIINYDTSYDYCNMSLKVRAKIWYAVQEDSYNGGVVSQ